jgi:hypothetical protein
LTFLVFFYFKIFPIYFHVQTPHKNSYPDTLVFKVPSLQLKRVSSFNNPTALLQSERFKQQPNLRGASATATKMDNVNEDSSNSVMTSGAAEGLPNDGTGLCSQSQWLNERY